MSHSWGDHERIAAYARGERQEPTLADKERAFDFAHAALEREMRAARASYERGGRAARDLEPVARLRDELHALRRDHGRSPWLFLEDRAPGWR